MGVTLRCATITWLIVFHFFSMANRVAKYIRFEGCGLSDAGKTRIWRIFNFHHNEVVGWVKWYGGFRRYCFYVDEPKRLRFFLISST
jgi:hypothetical protein